MLSFKHCTFAGVAILLSLMPATAQTPGQRIVLEQLGAGQRQEGLVRVQSNITFFVAGATGDSEDAQKTREKAQRSSAVSISVQICSTAPAKTAMSAAVTVWVLTVPPRR